MRDWMHTCTFVVRRGTIKAYCRCGWQSKKAPLDERDNLQMEFIKHTGLIEKPKQRQQEL